MRRSATARQLEKLGVPSHRFARAPSTISERAGRGEVQRSVLDTLKASGKAMTRADLLGAMGAKGDKARESSISNAIVGLSKAGRVVNINGSYSLSALSETREAA